jgi:hypothetical protein
MLLTVRDVADTASLKLIHTYHAVAMLCPCHATKGLNAVFPIRFTQFSHVWFTHAMPRSCCSESDFSRPWHCTTWTWHDVWISIGCPETTCGQPCPWSASSGYHTEFHEGCFQKHTNSLNCRTSSSDISGYHMDFHEGHGTVREWLVSSMACVN